MSNRLFLFGFFFCLLLQSCIKQIDGPITIATSPYPKVELNLDQLGGYKNKIYYNLSTKSIVKTANSLDWHIAFASDASLTTKVMMNYALGKTCWGYTQNDTLWSRNITANDFNNQIPLYANHYDSFADLFKRGINNVYYLYYGSSYSPVKFQIISYLPNQVIFRYANVDGTNEKQITLALNPNTHYTYFSFSEQIEKDIEPLDKTSWDVEITRYTTFVTDFNQPQMYGVAGFINNPTKNINIAMVVDKSLDEIERTQFTSFSFSNKLTAIGHDWKKFNSASQDGFYTLPHRSYIVETGGKYFGIEFTAFSKTIDGKQMNGYPTFLIRDY